MQIGENSYEFPLIEGTENELAIDIKTLRSLSNGVITIDAGYKNTGACKSAITFLDGEKGILRYRGYSIEELAEKADFLEVAFLLIFGDLPNQTQLDKFLVDIKENSIIDEDIKRILESFPKSAHPMGILSSLTSALIAFNPEKKIVFLIKIFFVKCRLSSSATKLKTFVSRHFIDKARRVQMASN